MERTGKLESGDRLNLESDNAGSSGALVLVQTQKPVLVKRVRKGIVGKQLNM